MTTTIKAIETRYKGYRFRSRLEARWAVAFDHLGIPWDYEHEGYALKSGNYLPDFEITFENLKGHIFAEVKGDQEKLDGWEKIAEMSDQRAVLLLGNIPEPAATGGGRRAPAALFPLVINQHTYPAHFGLDQHLYVPTFALVKHGHYIRCWAYDTVEAAFEAARSARFERGG